MSPLPTMHQAQHGETYAAITTSTPLQGTAHALADTIRMVAIALVVLTLPFIGYWLSSRISIRWSRRVTLNTDSATSMYENTHLLSPSGIRVFESDISIDMIDEDGQTHSSSTEFDDLSDNGDLETIISSASATRLSFRIDSLPHLMKGGILERRGRKDIMCDTSAYYELNTIATGAPTLSAAHEMRKSVTRPIFGFNFQEITPPVGSPLWNRKTDISRTIVPGPLSHPPRFA